MKVLLMFRNRDFDLDTELPPNAADLIQDLELGTLFEAMAQGNEFLLKVAKASILRSLKDPEEIAYRQQVLVDCIEHSDIIREMYRIADEAIHGERRVFGFSFQYRSPNSVLYWSIKKLSLFVTVLKKLRNIATEQSGKFHSEGFIHFFEMLKHELSNEYFQEIENHLEQLNFKDGVLISAELGRGNKGINYVLLRKFASDKRNWIQRIFSSKDKNEYSFEIDSRDESGHRVLSELQERGINLVANAAAQSVDHILSFFEMLYVELGFYVGCLNLRDKLIKKGEPICIPTALASNEHRLSAEELYDPCLSLKSGAGVIGNHLSADGKELVIITGPNQGGKTTFLRSLGVGYLIMQCGMFVAAERFSASVSQGLFTHFKREEDVTMKSGKLDEELKRLSEIADRIKPNCLLLCNESLSSTNESEGSEIARQIVRAMLDSGVRIVFVTFLFDFAEKIYQQKIGTVLFLRAERKPDGQRTFRIVEGVPLPTAFGEDLYKQIFFVERPEQIPPVTAPQTGS